MDGALEERKQEDLCSEPILRAANESKLSRSSKSGIDPRTATSRESTRIYIWRQHLAAFLANIPTLVMGMTFGWTAPAVPILLGQVADGQPLRLSLEQASWVGGLMPLASLGGALVAGPLAERLGRKGALLLGALPTLIGWLLMAFAGPSVLLLMSGRALTGLAVGAASGPSALYCEEIADIRIRGAIGSLQFVMNCVGLLLMYALGALMPYFWFTALVIFLPAVFVLSFVWMPESPAYLAARGRLQDSQEALQWLRGPNVDFGEEVEDMLASRNQAVDAQEARSLSNICSKRPWQSNSLRGLTLVVALMFFQPMSGICMFVFYLFQIFQQAGGNISSSLSSVLGGAACVIGSVAAAVTVDKIGRRFLLLSSTILMGICLFSLAVYTLLNNNNWNTEGWRWIPLLAMIIYFVAFSLGLGTVPWFLIAEFLPMYSKGWASPIAVCTNRIFMFIVVKQSPLLLKHAGQEATYSIFGIMCFLCAVFTFFCIPETKGKSKADILKAIGGDEA